MPPSSVSAGAATSTSTNMPNSVTLANPSYCPDIILNDSFTNYLKNISTSQTSHITPSSPQCIMNSTLNDDLLSTNYYNSNNSSNNNNNSNIENSNTNYGVNNNYHSFTSNDYQKPFDRIQTLYPNNNNDYNNNYQFYTHYQSSNNF